MKSFYDWMHSKTKRLTEAQDRPPRVLWITGMGSRGQGPRELAEMGYDVKQIGTTTNRFAAYLGRFKRYGVMPQRADQLGAAHLATNVAKHNKEMSDEDFMPDVIVGTSQGGAVVMQVAHNYPYSKFVLGAPAWKVFGADPSDLPKDTIVIHGTRDIVVPAADSFELSKAFGFELQTYRINHTIPTKIIKDAIDKQLAKIGIEIPPSMAA